MAARFGRMTLGLLAVAGIAFLAGRGSVHLGGASIASAHPAQDPTRERPAQDPTQLEQPPEFLEEFAAWEEVSQPGEHHRALDVFLGEWNGEVEFRMHPDSAPMTSTGTVMREWVLDGRFLQEDVNFSMGGDTFKGIGYMGYNNIDQLYESVWLESMSTAVYTETGVYNSAEKKFQFFGQHREPDGSVAIGWSEIDVSNPDRHVAIMWAVDESGKPFKSFEGTFTRVK